MKETQPPVRGNEQQENGALRVALEHLQAGRLQQAAEVCERLLQQNPDCAGALHLMGVIAGQAGYLEPAVQLLERSIQLQPTASCHNDLGVTHRMRNRMDLAAACFEEALRLDPDFVDPHYNLGNLFQDLGQRERAAEHYRRAARLRPSHADAWNGLGAVLLDMDRAAEAEDCFRQALKPAPKFPEAWWNLGRALRKLGRAAEAESCFRQVVELWPHSAEAREDLGIALSEQGRMDEALACFEQALLVAPERAETYYNIGHAMQLEGRFEEALEPVQHALRLKPDFPEAWNNLGGCLLGRGTARCDQVKLALTDFDEAERCYRRAIELRPDYADAHANLGLLYLSQGRFEAGWKEWEWRSLGKESKLHRYQRPLWRGEPLEGKTILLHAEGGLGDTLQFVRYARLLHERGARVIVQCPRALRGVLAGCQGVDVLAVDGEDIPEFDVHASLMSVPGIVGTDSSSIPADVPYLFADPGLAGPGRTEFWRRELSNSGGLRVGIAWQGNPEYKGDRRRSVPLAQFEPLARIPGIRLFSLQVGHGSEQLEKFAFEWKIRDLGLPLAETAAVMMHLDLIVTSDSALAHLAGALARPTWLAVCYTPDWRWMLRREDSPWYPTMRLFRQPGPGQWPVVFEAMATQMREKAQGLKPV